MRIGLALFYFVLVILGMILCEVIHDPGSFAGRWNAAGTRFHATVNQSRLDALSSLKAWCEIAEEARAQAEAERVRFDALGKSAEQDYLESISH